MKAAWWPLAILIAFGSESSAQVTSISGTVYDITGHPLSGVTVWYDDWQTTTDESGNYSLPEASSVPDTLVTPPPASTSWGRVKAGFRSAPTNLAASRTLKATRDYDPGPNFLNFRAAGHWSAWHDMVGETGAVWLNATLPDSVGPTYGIPIPPDHFMYVWDINDSHPSNMDLIVYRSMDLPIAVDGDMNAESDWDLVRASIARLNEAIGEEVLVADPGHGLPSRTPLNIGIYIYHNSTYDATDAMVYDVNPPWWLIGARVYVRNTEFLYPDGRVLDHELDYRCMNFYSWQLPDSCASDPGIFRIEPYPMNDRNREHLSLHRSLWIRKELGQNDLIAFDYVQPWWP